MLSSHLLLVALASANALAPSVLGSALTRPTRPQGAEKTHQEIAYQASLAHQARERFSQASAAPPRNADGLLYAGGGGDRRDGYGGGGNRPGAAGHKRPRTN